MSIDIDKGFKRVEDLRFYEIKKHNSQKKVWDDKAKRDRPKICKRRGKYKHPEENRADVEKAKLLLIDGHNQKSVAYEIGRNLWTIARLIRQATGLTMKQFQQKYAPKPQ